jgi:hypothetical protein
MTGYVFADDWQPSGNDIYYNSGNVGIGKSNPDRNLEVFGVDPTIRIGDTGGRHLSFGIVSSGTTGAQIYTYNQNLYFNIGNSERMRITSTGNVGIGTTSPQSKLAVNGTITSKEVKVTTVGWSDFVFEDSYNLPSLNHVETYIKENKHLPGIPSAKEVEEEGLSMAEMMKKQMQKIEELTLYVIDLEKKYSILTEENKGLKKRISAIAR